MPREHTGTLDIGTLIAANNQSAAAFGLDTIERVLNADIAAHNVLMRQMLADLVDITQDRQRITGGSDIGDMTPVDEYGRAPTQKLGPNGQVAFPLGLYQFAIGWTRTWEQEKTPADYARATIAAEIAHRKRIINEIKRALLLSANYAFVDDLVDNIPFTIRRLTNADSQPIPLGPNAEVFDGTTHTHYLATAAFSATDANALINTVVEHGHGGQVRVYINKGQEAAWRALTGFQPYLDARLVLGTQANQVGSPRLDLTRLDNRAIGIFGSAEIWVKPWMPSNYALAFDVAYPGKPLALRERVAGSMDLKIAAEIDAHPLVARYMESKFGLGAWQRTNGAVLYSAGGSYTDPVIPN
jgi:hypothetical protein